MSYYSEEIEMKAQDVRKITGVDMERDINMIEILNVLGIVLRENVFNGAEGTFSNDDDKFVITLSKRYDENNPRDKFTLAHELGHLFLHYDPERPELIYSRKGTGKIEYEANEFAAAFLMPEDIYRQVIMENCSADQVDILEVAREFGVSKDAAANRGKFLGILAW
ncbi:hypothetical protein BG261_08630 [Floricoccus tropicus]|uniref:IrrE N-terminal-like domain-containing protein n=1 Tax=Floricoccus tropicus TaxID=1859473 RepID=A0A1E8GJG4_9LACT|nr:ImmA/IrrE family metallo-endopeptidase [Floricoccus tropicus]OFI48337.1 hypothetical protein BG261_08630 [Floricoccus tropicus]